jgi:vancomycin permeability regulator SanA
MKDITHTRAALVLGASVRPDGTPSPALHRRALHAAQLYLAGEVDVIIASGGIKTHPPCEADVIIALCREVGVQVQHLIPEREALSTEQNLRNVVPILAANHIQKLVIITDRFHRRRTAMVADRLGLVPRISCPQAPKLRLHTAAFRMLREFFALAWYWLRRVGR